MLASRDGQVMQTTAAEYKVPLLAAPAMPMEQLARVTTLAVSYLDASEMSTESLQAVQDAVSACEAVAAGESLTSSTSECDFSPYFLRLSSRVDSVLYVNETAVTFTLSSSYAAEVRVWNGDATLLMADGVTTHSLCETDVSCSALTVDDESDADALLEVAEAALERAGFLVEEDGARRMLGGDRRSVDSSAVRDQKYCVEKALQSRKSLPMPPPSPTSKSPLPMPPPPSMPPLAPSGDAYLWNPSEEFRTYSSVWGNADWASESMLDSPSAWVSQSNMGGEWMTIDTYNPDAYVVGVVTQPRFGGAQGVTRFQVEVSADGSSWTAMENRARCVPDYPTMFCSAQGGDVKTYSYFSTGVNARYVKFTPIQHYGHKSMRAGVIAVGVPLYGDFPYELIG